MRYDGFVNGDDAADLAGTLAYATTATAASAVGPYDMTPGGLSSPNYTVTFATGILDVTAATTTLTAANAASTYSEQAVNVTLSASVANSSTSAEVNEGTVTFTVTDGATTIGTAAADTTVVNGAASVTYVLPAGTPAKSYGIEAAYTPGANFLAATAIAKTLTVAKRDTTTTVVDANATFGDASVNLTATVAATSSSVNAGTVTFTVKRADATTVGSATTSATVVGGTANVTYLLPSGMGAGTYTIEAAYGGTANFNTSAATGGDAKTLTVAKKPTVVSASANPNPVQFSDITTLTATVTPNTEAGENVAGTVEFLLGSTSLGVAPVSGGVATLNYKVGQQAGSYVVSARFTAAVGSNFANGNNAAQSPAPSLMVSLEIAKIDYTGDGLKMTSGSSATSAPLYLAAVVTEEPDSSIGEKLGTTSLTFAVYKYTDMLFASPVATCPAPVTPTGPGTGAGSCTTASLPADNYTVKIQLAVNGYYTAPVEIQAVTIAVPGNGFTTGGGWLVEPSLGSKSNYGFTVKYLRNGNVQGNSIYIYRVTLAAGNSHGLPAGNYNWIIKSNAMDGLAQTCTTATPKVCTARFAGKSNITAVNRATGVATSLGGNYQFQVDVTDNREPGSSPGPGPDTYAIRVWNSSGTYYQLASPTAQQKIDGGNIQVKP